MRRFVLILLISLTLPAISACGSVASAHRVSSQTPSIEVAPASGAAVAPLQLNSRIPSAFIDISVDVPAPPPIDSEQLQLEMAELFALRSSLTEADQQTMLAWDTQAVVRWNKLARDMVAQYQVDPLQASSIYMLLSVAQNEALRTADTYQRLYQRQMPPAAESGLTPLLTSAAPGSYPSEHALLAAASATVLEYFFPGEQSHIAAQRTEEQESRLWAGVNCRSDIIAGNQAGSTIAALLIERLRGEFAQANVGMYEEPPHRPGAWIVDPTNPRPPDAPGWRRLAPWLMERADQFRAPPPPEFGSAEYTLALQEVRDISDHRTDEQLRIAQFWNDGKGSPTPPGHWNQIAADLIVAQGLGNQAAAKTLAYMNLALYDAGIAAWDTKYTYWLIRPWNADPAIQTVPAIPPSHPSYVSGHSTFSAAAATVLAAAFPEKAAELDAMVQEASVSRVYGGIHYRFDGEAGIAIGKQVGALAVARMQAEP